MKTLFLSLTPDFPLETTESNIVIRLNLINDIIYEIGSELAFSIKEINFPDKSRIITDYKVERTEDYNRLIKDIEKEIMQSLSLDEQPTDFTITLPSDYIDWLTYNSNPYYSQIGKLLQVDNKIELDYAEIYDEYIRSKILPQIKSIKNKVGEIVNFTIINLDTPTSFLVKEIVSEDSGLTFEPFNGGQIQYVLGANHEKGIGVSKDYKKALYHYEKSAKCGNSNAINNLGLFYQYGLGVKRDANKAFQYFKNAKKLNLFEGYANVGFCYQEGLGVEKNIQKAIDNYKIAAENGIAAGQINLANIYYEGLAGQPDYTEAFKWYKLNSEYPEQFQSQYITGRMLEEGIGVEQNLSDSYRYYAKAAVNNYKDSCYKCGYLLESGYGDSTDEEKILSFYEKGAKIGEPKAATALAQKKSKNKSPEEIINLLKIGIKEGYEVAQYELAVLLREQPSVKKLIKGYSIDSLLDSSSEKGYLPAINLKKIIDVERKEKERQKREERKRAKEEELKRLKAEEESRKKIEMQRIQLEEEIKKRKEREEEDARKKKTQDEEERKIKNERLLKEFEIYCNTEEAIEIFRQSNPRTIANINNAIELLIEPAHLGYPYARAWLGLILLLIEPDNRDAYKLIESSLIIDDPTNIYQDFLTLNEENRNFAIKNVRKNYRFLQKKGEKIFEAFDLNYYRLTICLGIAALCQLKGFGTPQNKIKALNLIRYKNNSLLPWLNGTEKGDWLPDLKYGFINYVLGISLKEGIVIEKNISEGNSLLKKAKFRGIEEIMKIPKGEYYSIMFDKKNGLSLIKPEDKGKKSISNKSPKKDNEVKTKKKSPTVATNKNQNKQPAKNKTTLQTTSIKPETLKKETVKDSSKISNFLSKLFKKK